jgi:hypothetical protein
MVYQRVLPAAGLIYSAIMFMQKVLGEKKRGPER